MVLAVLAAACSIADENRCGEGYVYQKPGCFRIVDSSMDSIGDDAMELDGGADGIVGTQTCMQISLCKQACNDASCREECAADGCESAQEAAAALEACSQDLCTTECADPKASACVDCTQTKCSTDLTACLGNRC